MIAVVGRVSRLETAAPARLVQVNKFCAMTGYSVAAVRAKIKRAVWREGVHYRRAPDGHILMDMEAYQRWAEGRS
jgi:hypothetical protein